MNPHANNADNDNDDDDVDTTGGRIIVCAEFSIPSQTKRTKRGGKGVRRQIGKKRGMVE